MDFVECLRRESAGFDADGQELFNEVRVIVKVTHAFDFDGQACVFAFSMKEAQPDAFERQRIFHEHGTKVLMFSPPPRGATDQSVECIPACSIIGIPHVVHACRLAEHNLIDNAELPFCEPTTFDEHGNELRVSRMKHRDIAPGHDSERYYLNGYLR